MTDRQQIWQWFSRIDVDKSGTLDVMELQKALSLGGARLVCSDGPPCGGGRQGASAGKRSWV
jgi:hypothetical protein